MRIAALSALAGVMVLAACGQEKDDIRLQEISCPNVAVPPYGRALVQWQGGGHDVTNLAYRVSIADATGSCTRVEGRPVLTARITVSLAAVRGPALKGRSISVPYFVAVVHKGTIIDKQDYVASGVFPDNTESMTLTGQPVSMTLPILGPFDGSSYTIETGMQLTQEQLDENRAAGRQ